jgi:hypothetical protein
VTLLFLAHLVVTYVGPIVTGLLAMALTSADALPVLYASVYALIAAATIRLMISVRFRMPIWHVLLQPITALWTVVIGLNSIRWALSSRGSQWKGRSYALIGDEP